MPYICIYIYINLRIIYVIFACIFTWIYYIMYGSNKSKFVFFFFSNIPYVYEYFTAAFTVSVGVSAQQLDLTIGSPCKFKNHTKGLLGVFNDDPYDDLLPPGENAVPLANSSSEKTIFSEFGERCMLKGLS